jgi:hypothetical protein
MPRGSRTGAIPDREKAKEKLDELWAKVLDDAEAKASPEIVALVNSEQTSIRFCLPTQLLGKLIDPTLDALCLQRGDGSSGRWDPRSFASKAIVPWNRTNQNVLGKSGDPYVSNPLRRPRVDQGLEQMADRDQWDRLVQILEQVQLADDPVSTEAELYQVLVAIRERLREFTFLYVVPARVSIWQAEDLVTNFLSEKSGGDRGLAVVAALFETIRHRLGIYHEVRRGVINAADSATDAAGDLECVAKDGHTVLVVEVKERFIVDDDVHIAVSKARSLDVQELLLCTFGISTAEEDVVRKTISSAWASGTNVYHATVTEFMRGVLPLLGETSTREFVVQIGNQLDVFSTQPKHRKAWRGLLDEL